MRYCIDQSGKIEQTNKNTVLCVSNSTWSAIKISAHTKRQLQEIFRRHGQIRNFVIFTFSAILTHLIKMNKNIHLYYVDLEYFGHESSIRNIVLEMMKKSDYKPRLEFIKIGKNALAHHRAYAVAIKKIKPTKNLNFKEVFELIKKTEVGKRLKDV